MERYIEAARRQLCQQDSISLFCIRHEIHQVKCILHPLAKRRQIQLKFNVRAERCKLLGDPIKFQRIIINLVTNAMDAYGPDPTTPNPAVKVMIKIDDQSLVILVRDKGVGINTKQLPYLFKPFYSSKQPDSTSGMGIGLSTVKQYAEEAFGGTITATSNNTSGTEFRVALPLHSPEI